MWHRSTSAPDHFKKSPVPEGEGLAGEAGPGCPVFTPGAWELRPPTTHEKQRFDTCHLKVWTATGCLSEKRGRGKQTFAHPLSAPQPRSQALGRERGGVRTRPVPSSWRGNGIIFKSAGEETLKVDQTDGLLTGMALIFCSYCLGPNFVEFCFWIP